MPTHDNHLQRAITLAAANVETAAARSAPS